MVKRYALFDNAETNLSLASLVDATGIVHPLFEIERDATEFIQQSKNVEFSFLVVLPVLVKKEIAEKMTVRIH